MATDTVTGTASKLQSRAKVPLRPARLAVATLVGLAIAGVAFAQAGSSVLMPKQPAFAAQLLPFNGLALEQAATRQFMAGVTTAADIKPAAKAALPVARKAFAYDPLSPKSLALMALAEDNADRKQKLLDGATRLNRRDLLLQGLVLDARVAKQDYAGTLETLDRILRVHPEQKSNFFPVLTNALKNEAAAQELGGILDSSSSWHAQFLEAASSDADALPNLARLRLTRDQVDPQVDQRLISGLVAGGKIEQAHQVYLQATANTAAAVPSPTRRLGWGSAFPPFDWKMAKESTFRAQPAVSDTALEIFVRSGNGGILAERLIEAPKGHSTINISHSITPAAQVKDVRLQVSCPGADDLAIDRPLRIRPMEIAIPNLSGQCRFLKVAFYARSWSGRSTIRGEIAQLELSAN